MCPDELARDANHIQVDPFALSSLVYIFQNAVEGGALKPYVASKGHRKEFLNVKFHQTRVPPQRNSGRQPQPDPEWQAHHYTSVATAEARQSQ